MTQNPKPAIQFTRRGLMVWIGLVVFIAGWMFVLGILVGRGTAPVALNTHQLEQELAKLKARMVQKEQAKVEAQASGAGDQKTELGFYEALKKSKPDTVLKVKTDPHKPPTGGVAKAKRPAIKSHQKAKPAVAARPTPKTAPPAAQKATAKPETLTQLQSLPSGEASEPVVSDAKSRFTVQVAAFKEIDGAEHLVAQLRRKGYPAYQIRTQLSAGGVWYRVRVGAFSNRAAADGMLKRLNSDRIKGMVVATP